MNLEERIEFLEKSLRLFGASVRENISRLEEELKDHQTYELINERMNKLEAEYERLAELCLRMFDHLETHRHTKDSHPFGNVTSAALFPVGDSDQNSTKIRIVDPIKKTLSERKTDDRRIIDKEKKTGQPQGDQGGR